jgi:hypothetical protein
VKNQQKSKKLLSGEDYLLIFTWLNVRKDPIMEVDRQIKHFWASVYVYFIKNGGNLNNHSQVIKHLKLMVKNK